jgi:hypothetical protein
MEVHHHPDIRPKNFKEYLLEFVMIFLAVTLGFFAEQIREHRTEQKTANDLVIALIEDLKKDTAQLNQLAIQENQWGLWADTLSTLIDTPFEKINIHDFYRLGFNISIFQSLIFKQSKGTLNQLENSGYLRYFINSSIPGMLADYEAQIERLLDFEKLEFYWIDQYQAPFMLDHTNLKGVNKIIPGANFYFYQNPKFVNVTADTINSYLNHLLALRYLNYQVVETLKVTLKKATEFIQMIQKKYHLEKK